MSIPLISSIIDWCMAWFLLSHCGVQHHNFFKVYPLQAYMPPDNGLCPMSGVYLVAAPPTALSRGNIMLLNQLYPSYSSNMVGHTTLGTQQSPSPLPSLHGSEGSLFPGSAPSIDMVNSDFLVDMQPSDSSLVTEYQVDDFTHTWLAECFIVLSHSYAGFTGKVSRLPHLPLEPGCEDYSFLAQAVDDFKTGS